MEKIKYIFAHTRIHTHTHPHTLHIYCRSHLFLNFFKSLHDVELFVYTSLSSKLHFNLFLDLKHLSEANNQKIRSSH